MPSPPPVVHISARGASIAISLNMATLARIEDVAGQSIFEITQRMASLSEGGHLRIERLRIGLMHAVVAGAFGCTIEQLDERMEMHEAVSAFMAIAPALFESISRMMPSGEGDDAHPPMATEASGA